MAKQHNMRYLFEKVTLIFCKSNLLLEKSNLIT